MNDEMTTLNWDRLADRAAAVARSEVQWLRAPENRAYLAGCFIGGFLAADRSMAFLPGLALIMISGYMAQHAYRACQHLETLAHAAGADTTG